MKETEGRRIRRRRDETSWGWRVQASDSQAWGGTKAR